MIPVARLHAFSRAASGWDRFWYTVIWLLSSVQALIFTRCLRQPVWRSFDGSVVTPTTITNAHLRNLVHMLKREALDRDDYSLTELAFIEEAKRRGIR